MTTKSRSARIDVQTFLQKICGAVCYSVGVPSKAVSGEVMGSRSTMSVERAISVGLILNELLANALIRSSGLERTESISVQFEARADGTTVLRIADGVPMVYRTRTAQIRWMAPR